jgi:hypothetical protein
MMIMILMFLMTTTPRPRTRSCDSSIPFSLDDIQNLMEDKVVTLTIHDNSHNNNNQ